ncbi:hypothetical protein CANTEDRAFT_115182 [Yamadazyma tenuis ATCC 10573]|uniref:BZIP domain-containing protein n=1 Tax=Candida tenuis (strain ATCC 10573 / BCRC 21748 / CBS 615 / JCM 9827 / NBRC 10315 / NRRL Y-1498 / VKM Y-70) TaxID=590646 RepID=G3B8A5_CANTC|nr:uncharacterized protein CANTEDRAFT_115182 [Yamadazyma tenuis ATCC 10573]XP_006688806.1 uncharacterized protein CANTEDRAFT_115182 [Yamadazyma tenuis ATCC 10573]EGV62635.1 hypothetical protein CANTEDRAFT_115182 [Yamadazyma tenuis ATCC 10573]EGV62636.1 hypothetical protein CANTEDRAFT_115182 [Yamadazyma tenuis ATCC 10573]
MRKRKRGPVDDVSESSEADVKRVKNTMAARRYRERQRKDVEILDARIKQLEEELATSRLEVVWWKMEAEKWRSQAEKK